MNDFNSIFSFSVVKQRHVNEDCYYGSKIENHIFKK